ncbi:MAG: hypothetical protein QG675_465 [Patescibacteria group bacterium]|jgi:hypothetical protein|nr:hypothetical protein [Patescibacteria group bacterium]
MKSIEVGQYQHYKGNKYLVMYVAKHSETLEDMVVYVSLYENPVSQIWVRPAKMFMEEVEYKGKKVPRFAKID